MVLTRSQSTITFETLSMPFTRQYILSAITKLPYIIFGISPGFSQYWDHMWSYEIQTDQKEHIWCLNLPCITIQIYPVQTILHTRWGISNFLSYGCYNPWAPFTKQGLTLIPACISNHMASKVWDEITYPFPNLNGWSVEVWEWISHFIPHSIMDVITYPCWD